MAIQKKSTITTRSGRQKVNRTPRALTAKQREAIKRAQAQKKNDNGVVSAKYTNKAARNRQARSSVLGCFGTIIKFEVSADRILTFQNLKRTQAGRWVVHSIVSKTPRSEFLGPDLTEVTMEVTLSAEHGVRPLSMIRAIETAVRNGTVDNIAIGGKIFGFGGHKWYIESVSETWDEIWNMGELVRAKLALTFREYV